MSFEFQFRPELPALRGSVGPNTRSLHDSSIALGPRRIGADVPRRLKLRQAASAANDRAPIGGPAKRAMDIALASIALAVLAPLMLVVAGLVRLTLGGRILFAQERVGTDGTRFTCYKFRTMPADADDLLKRHLLADPDAAIEWRETRKLRNDPRVGCLGNILRKSSLDELPQLLNVLRGEMSIVGPRPIVPAELAYYGRHASACFRARPGLTGMWQVSGRNRVAYRTRVALDRYYARNWSIWLDCRLLIQTIPALLSFDKTS